MFESYDEDIGRLTNTTNKKLIHYLNSKLEKFNLTTEQWMVLLKLSEQDKINQKLLAKISGKDQPTLTRILDILERKNFIERQHSKKDRRAFTIHITDEGVIISKKVTPFLEETFKDILKDISNEKLNIYVEVLLQIHKNINNL